MITHIVVPLDGSDASERALAPARELAERFAAHLTLLTVMLRFPESRIVVPKLDARSVEQGSQYLADVISRHALPSSVARQAVLGTPAESIVTFANSASADLIVMTTHGTTGTDALKHSIGSVAWKLLQHAPCPIYLVPVHPAPTS